MVTVRGITSRTATPKFLKTDPGTRRIWNDVQTGDELRLQIQRIDTSVDNEDDSYEKATVEIQEERILELKEVGSSGNALAGEQYDSLIIFSELDNRVLLEIGSQVENKGFSAYYGHMGWQAINEIEAEVVEVIKENGQVVKYESSQTNSTGQDSSSLSQGQQENNPTNTEIYAEGDG